MRHIFSKDKYPEVYRGYTYGGKYYCVSASGNIYEGAMPFVCVYKTDDEIWFLGTKSIVGEEIYIPSRNKTEYRRSLTWDQAHDLTFKVRLHLIYDKFVAIGKVPSYKDIVKIDYDNNYYCIDSAYWVSREDTIIHGFHVNQWGYLRGGANKHDTTIGVVPLVKLRFKKGGEED